VRVQIQEELPRTLRPKFLTASTKSASSGRSGEAIWQRSPTCSRAGLMNRLAGLNVRLEVTTEARVREAAGSAGPRQERVLLKGP
jgi:hypothetical protein